MYRRFAALAALAASLTMVGAPRALADEDGSVANNVVSVRNQEDGASRIRARTSVAHDSGPTVANDNEAFAFASCTDCRTVAAAVQVVLVEGVADDVRPTNFALALNENCLRCATFAYAHQVVLTPGQRVDIGERAQDQIGEIQRQIRTVAGSDEPFPQMNADLDSLTDQLVAVVQGEVQRAGTSAGRNDDRRVDEHDD